MFDERNTLLGAPLSNLFISTITSEVGRFLMRPQRRYSVLSVQIVEHADDVTVAVDEGRSQAAQLCVEFGEALI